MLDPKRPRFGNHYRYPDLTKIRVGHAHHRTLGNTRQVVDVAFNFCGYTL